MAETQAIGIIQKQVMGRAAMLSYQHIFLMFGDGDGAGAAAPALHAQGEGARGGRRPL